ncbi:hypothetical protein C8Q77DRAFT_1077930 [Trametes polyzona]|nr:hypothetical protein C8Q77DRAFT_1077930 [Trametes polyzona]
MIFIMNWIDLIVHFGDTDSFHSSIWPMPMAIGITAWTTFLVQGFFTYRIHTLSRAKWSITGILVTLSIVRLGSAMVSCGALLHFASFPVFFQHFKGSFLLGLSSSAALDVLITTILCYYLRQRRSGLARTDRVVDMLTLYTVENGMLTCIATIASLICWAAMQTNLIFLALHLSVGKLYANTLLASLNARRSLSDRTRSSPSAPAGQDYPMSILWPTPPHLHEQAAAWVPHSRTAVSPKPVQVNIDIERTIHREELLRGSRAINLVRTDSFSGLDNADAADVKE